jgi:hypothetical protein
MKILRAAPLLLALAIPGCILISGQVLVTYDLPDITVPSPLALVPIQVDLNTVSDYNDHKSNLKGVADEALVGLIKNDKAAPLSVQVWITPEETSYLSAAQVTANGTLVWGPLNLAAGELRRVDWDASAALITQAGRAALEREVKGDGKFTVYVVGTGADFGFTVTEGKFLAIINAGI